MHHDVQCTGTWVSPWRRCSILYSLKDKAKFLSRKMSLITSVKLQRPRNAQWSPCNKRMVLWARPSPLSGGRHPCGVGINCCVNAHATRNFGAEILIPAKARDCSEALNLELHHIPWSWLGSTQRTNINATEYCSSLCWCCACISSIALSLFADILAKPHPFSALLGGSEPQRCFLQTTRAEIAFDRQPGPKLRHQASLRSGFRKGQLATEVYAY